MIPLFTLNQSMLRAKSPTVDVQLRQLAHAAALGESAAQQALYESLYAYGMSIALHYAGQREEAQEITQDAFVKLFRQLVKEVPSGSLKAYFSRIVINTAIDLLRKRKNRPYTEEITDRCEAIAGSARNTGRDRLQQQEIYRLLQMLSPVYRMVFNLHVLEGYSHPEIAKKLGISVGSSKSNLSKARKNLQELAAVYYQINEPRNRE
ncbi:MAG: RNA polymerase sigma factor [Bacteroidota bacterium]